MSDANSRQPVRVRTRPVPHPERTTPSEPQERLIADSVALARKKRQPNTGSFKKGEPSRNPTGRPKGANGKKAIVRKVLLERVTVRLPSGSKKLSVFEALLLRERDMAFAGDWRARKTLLELARWALPDDVLEEAGITPSTDSETDRAILEWFEEEVRQKEQTKHKKPGGGK